MSKENRPNLNAVGLAVDIIASVEKYRRGGAARANITTIIELTRYSIEVFVEEINDILDHEFKKE